MIPKNWSQVTVQQYAKYYPLREEKPTDPLEAHDLKMEKICALTGMELKEVLELTEDILGFVDDLERTPFPKKMIKYFRLNGQLYKVKPNPRSFTAGEFMAVMNACKDNTVDGLHRILFNVCDPIKNIFGKKIKFKPEDIEDRMNDFKKLPVSIGWPIALFFWNLSDELNKNILEFSTQQMEKLNKKLQKEADYLERTDGL